MKLSNRQIGAVGVAKVTAALLQSGYQVLTPIEDYAGYDLVAEKAGKFHRVQVKTTTGMESRRAHYRFVTCKGDKVKFKYYKSDVDWIVCYALDSDLYWLFRVSECRTSSKKLYPRTGSSWRILGDL